MKANGIPCTDYAVRDEALTLWLTDTTQDTVLALDPVLVTITTDAGDVAEVFPGYTAVERVTYRPTDRVYIAVLTRTKENPMNGVADRLAQENRMLRAQIQAGTDRLDFIEDCIAELAVQAYKSPSVSCGACQD